MTLTDNPQAITGAGKRLARAEDWQASGQAMHGSTMAVRLVARSFVLGWAALGGLPLAAHAAPAASQGSCPDLTGHYRIGLGTAQHGEALKILKARYVFFGSEAKFSGPDASGLRMWIKSSATDKFPEKPNRVLKQGIDFNCKDGWLVLTDQTEASRHFKDSYLEGRSVAKLGINQSAGGLAIEVSFLGRRKKNIFSYDSARLGIPIPFTSQTINEWLHWPAISLSDPVPTMPAAEPAALRDARRLLKPRLGGVDLVALSQKGSSVLATLTAQDSRYIAPFEDKLRSAAIDYTVETEPVWTNNQYVMALLITPSGAASTTPWQPTAMRVEHELRQHRNAMVDVAKVSKLRRDGVYLAEVRVRPPETVERYAERLRTNSDMFSEVAMENEPAPADAGKGGNARLRLKVR